MLREIGVSRDPVSGKFNLNEFKVVYIAPMKSLVREIVTFANFTLISQKKKNRFYLTFENQISC